MFLTTIKSRGSSTAQSGLLADSTFQKIMKFAGAPSQAQALSNGD